MNLRKRLLTFLLMTLFLASSTSTALAKNITLQNTKSDNFPAAELPLTTVDGYKIQKPNVALKLNKENSSLVNSTSQPNYSNTKKVADEKASAITSYYGGTSLQYALIDTGNIVLSGNAGLASIEKKASPTSNTMYGIGSVSKIFTTTAVMKLVDSGRIQLDTPVTEYIKDFKMADARYKKITVRMLLNHSSGLMGSSFSNAMLFQDNDSRAHDTFLAQLSAQRLKSDPGAYSVYCNDGFTLAEILVERVTGESFTSYITHTILNPLKLSNTKTPVSTFDRDQLAKAYSSTTSPALPTENILAIGAGGIYSTAENLCNLATTFTSNSNGILSKKALKEMEGKEYLRGIWPREKDADSILGYGLGWDAVDTYPFNQYNIKALSKSGDTLNYHSALIVLPEQNMAVAVVSSGASSAYDQVMAQEILLNALKEKGTIKEIKPDKAFPQSENTAVPEEIKKYEGLYLSASSFMNTSIDENGTLNLSISQYGQQSFNYSKDGYFISKDRSQRYRFIKESNGKTYLEEGAYINLPLLGQIAITQYIAQKETPALLPMNLSKAWNKRNGKKYYLINEKYSSMIFALECPVAQVGFYKGLEDYLGLDKIADKNNAHSILEGPGVMSRDQVDYKFIKNGKFEYLASQGNLYVEDSSIDNLPYKDNFIYKIDKAGFAKWFNIGSEAAGKAVTISLPSKAAFVVYDKAGAVVNDSLVTGSNKAILPENGKIVFLGAPGAEFKLQYSK